MIRMIAIAICLLAGLLLSGYKSKEPTKKKHINPTSEDDTTITFINEVKEADVWILPATEKNLKTTLWGTATIAKLGTNRGQPLPIGALGEPGTYIIRMIDKGQQYYGVDGVTLEKGYSLRFFHNKDSVLSYFIEVTDSNGVLVKTYAMFSAKL